MNALTSRPGSSNPASGTTSNNGKLYSGSAAVGLSPLMLAARNGHVDAVRFLLKNGADLLLTNGSGETALHHAVECSVNPKECITALLNEYGSQPIQKSLLNTLVRKLFLYDSGPTLSLAKNISFI